MNNKLNKYKYPGAKRLMLEAQELKDNTEDYCAQPIDDNLFEWHFTVRGPPDTAFDGGYYHGRLSFPTEYPMKPPSIILLTPNGRFETNKKICLSISGYHPETWQPSWSVRTALLALIAFMPTKANRAIGSLDFPEAERRKLAEASRTWRCETCGLIKDLLVQPGCATSQQENASTLPANCEPSTSRVDDCATNIDGDEKSQSSNQIESSSGSQCRDSSPDLKEAKQLSHTSSNYSSQNVDSPTRENRRVNEQQKLNFNQSSAYSSTRDGQVIHTTLQSTVVTDRRRAYPPLVLTSVFILLFVLIVRRVSMVIQL